MGTPNLCALPTAISAPSSAGVLILAKDRRSQITIAFPPFLWIKLIDSLGSFTSPKVSG